MRRLQRLPLHDRLPDRHLPPRRRLLPLVGLLVLVLLAGCSAPGSLTMDPVTDGEIAERASRSLDGPEPESGDDPEARMLRTAIENGSATMESPNAPVREGLPFEYDGAYYDVAYTVVDERTVTSVSLLIDYNATEPSGERIAYEDLPAADRRAVDGLLPPRNNRRVEGYDLGASTTYNDSGLERSVLVSDSPTVVVFEGEAYPVEFDGTSEFTVETYRYTATKVADSPDEYARDLKEEHLFTLSGLSEAERSVVDEAIGEGSYYAEDDDDEAFGSVVERFRRHEPIEGGEDHGEWLVRYEGETYWANLEYYGFGGSSESSGNSESGQEGQVEGE